MQISSWLDSVRSRLNLLSKRRRPKKRLRAVTEKLEDRTLLSVSVFFVDGELEVISDSNDSIRLTVVGSNVIVEEAVPGGLFSIVPTLGQVPAADVTGIVISAEGSSRGGSSPGSGNNDIDLSTLGSTDLNNVAGVTVMIFGGDGDDTIRGTIDFPETIFGGDGNDTLFTQLGAHIIDLGDGDDSITAGAGVDSIIGGDGDDSILSGDGPDTIIAGDGADFIDSGDGDDSILGEAGSDTILAGMGNDSIDGGSGTDMIRGADGDDSIQGGSGDDSITGDAGSDTIEGNSGDDTISGGDDADTLIGNSGDDSMSGNDGDDSLRGNSGNDTMSGNNGSDTLRGGSDEDSLLGDRGDDRLRGNGGDDFLCGGFESDNMDGDRGDDFVVSVCELVTPLGIAVGDAVTAEGSPADVVLVVDQSGSTGAGFSGNPVGDVNGDGSSDTVLDAELASLLEFQQDLIARGVSARLSVISFATASVILDMDPSIPGVQFSTTPTADNDGNGITDFEEVVRSIQITGATFFEPPLQDAITVFNSLGTAPGEGTLVFLSDGAPFDVGAYDDEVVTLNGLGIDVRAFGVGAGANLPNLQLIDPGAVIVLTSDALAMALTGLGVTSGSMGVDLVLSEPAPFGFTIDFVTSPGTAIEDVDYQAGAGTVTFITGQSSAAIPITIINDTIQEPPETFFITISNPVATVPTIIPIQIIDAVAQVTIFDQGTTVPPTPPPPPPVTIPALARDIDFDDDTLNGNDGNDTLIGDAGNDTMEGGRGNDSIEGRLGRDTIMGDGGRDTILGGGGNDTIQGNGGEDQIDGGLGDDLVIWFGATDATDVYTNLGGSDTVEVRGNDDGDVYTIQKTPLRILQIAHDGETITIDETFNEVSLNAGDGADIITLVDLKQVPPIVLNLNGEAGKDIINAAGVTLGKVRLNINGGDDDDVVVGSDDAETIRGGDGNDTINGGDGDDSIFGNAGDDSIDGQKGDDIIRGGFDNDSIHGSDGNDVLIGGKGADTLRGLRGDDSLFGNDGKDKLVGSQGDDSLDGGNNKDTLLAGTGNDTLIGGTGNDFLRGHNGDDLIIGGDGNDKIRGDGGNDTILAGDGDDLVYADAGDDVVDAGDGDDRVFGSAGNDVILGGDGDDILRGGAGSDTLFGENGDDTLVGQGSTDVLAGGEGDDTFDDPSEVDEEFTLSMAILEALDRM